MAIAHDSTTSGASARGASSLTVAHTCTGSDVGLFVTLNWINANFTAGTITGVTYNGNAMSKLADYAPSANFYTSLWFIYIGTGDATSHDVVATVASGGFNSITLGAISLTGVSSTQNGAVNSASGTSTSPSVTVTTTNANAWLVTTAIINDTVAHTSPSASGNNTIRWNIDTDAATAASGAGITTTTTTAGSNTASLTLSSSVAWKLAVLEVVPQSAPPNSTDALMFGHFA